MNKNANIVILLTATVDTKGVINTVVDDPLVRYEEYRAALRKWLESSAVSQVIFCDNSGFDLTKLKKDISDSSNNHKLELMQFDGQHFDRNLGKGYGEMLTMEYISNNSKLFSDADLLLKVNGRYSIKNISNVVESLKPLKDSFVVADFHSNLTAVDSRVFAFNPLFFKDYFLKMKPLINESGGLAFEWALARAIHRAMNDGKQWEMLPATPIIEGRSGSTGKRYSDNFFKMYVKQLIRILLRYLLKH